MKLNPFLYSMILLVIISCATKAPTPSPQLPLTQQLKLEYERHEISKDQYYTYLAFSIFNQDMLPERFQGSLASHDATPIIRQIQRVYPELSYETQTIIKQWVKPLPPKPIKSGINQ